MNTVKLFAWMALVFLWGALGGVSLYKAQFRSDKPLSALAIYWQVKPCLENHEAFITRVDSYERIIAVDCNVVIKNNIFKDFRSLDIPEGK